MACGKKQFGLACSDYAKQEKLLPVKFNTFYLIVGYSLRKKRNGDSFLAFFGE
tara:strand:+ start:137 stop:295 length:159 start_codon:yes stop_codon:yes gene_type:complete